MTAQYVRDTYGVPAKRGDHVRVAGRPATIVGFRGQYLRVRFHDSGMVLNAHPTWRVEYLTERP